MEFKIAVQELQNILSKLSGIVKINEDDTTSMICLETKDKDVMEFKVNNGSVIVVIDVSNIEIINKGKVLFRLRDIKGYVSKFIQFAEGYGTEFFHFIINNDEGIIKTKTFFKDNPPSYRNLKFELFNSSNFKTIEKFDKVRLITNSSILKRGINKVLYCVNPTEIRGALQGVSVVISDNKISFAGSNGVKLSEDNIYLQNDNEPKNVGLNKEVQELQYIFKYSISRAILSVLDDDSQVFIGFEGRYVYLKSNNIFMIGGLILSDDFPSYKKLFECEKSLIVPKINFIDGVEAAIEVVDPEDNDRLTLNFNGKRFCLKSNAVEMLHEFDEDFAYNLDIDVNGKFLAEILRNFVSDNLIIDFTEGNNYIIIRSQEDDNIALITIINRRYV